MRDIKYQIEFYDYWNTSSGLAGGALADSLCAKDINQLPYVPGKTLKGLMREAVEELGDWHPQMFSQEFVHAVFGEEERAQDDALSGRKTKEAGSFFSNATLDEATVSGILSQQLGHSFFEYISSTAVEIETGIAKSSSLRRIEYTIPCTLYGTIYSVADKDMEMLKYCAAYVKRLGLNRHRGYGRCKITLLP